MPLYSLTPPKQAYRVEANGKVLDAEFEELMDAAKIAKAYSDKGFKAIIIDASTGQFVGSFGN